MMIPLILCPYTLLCEETVAALPDGQFVRMEHADHYRQLLADRWRRGTPFILVEHDVVPTRAQLAALEECPEPWCHYGYGPGDWVPTFGCVRFSAELIAATPQAFTDPSWPWNQLDARFAAYARAAGCKPHWHYPHVLHMRTPVIGADGTMTRRRLNRAEELYVLESATKLHRAETGVA